MRYFFISLSLFSFSFSYGQNTILWKVTKPNLNYISYLLGTDHSFGESFIDSFQIIKSKIQKSDIIITETKVDRDQAIEYYNSRTSTNTLSSMVSPEDLEFIKTILVPVKTSLDKYTPGELYIKLMAIFPTYKCEVIKRSDKMIMDEYIQFLGLQEKKKLEYFETNSKQLEMITQATNAYDWKFFKKNISTLLKKFKTQTANTKECISSNDYFNLKIDYRLGENCDFIKDKNINETLVQKRNNDWLQKIPSYFDNNNCFIAVGLGHFYNKCGLIEQLKALGYTVEPVTMN